VSEAATRCRCFPLDRREPRVARRGEGAEAVDEVAALGVERLDLGVDLGCVRVDRDEERELTPSQRVEDLAIVPARPHAVTVGHEPEAGDVLTRREEVAHGLPHPGEREARLEQRRDDSERDEVTESVRAVVGRDEPGALPVREL
jgi:hypothetical protein